MILRLFLLLGLIFLLCFSLEAQELPPIENFAPTDYRSESQNWGISQGKEGRMYFANNKGLLEYNGSQWTVYPSPNGSIMRSVLAVGSRIYTGCYMEFGYWERDGTGELHYTSLPQTLKPKLIEDEEFWGILALDDWIVFQSHSGIYVYHTKNHTLSAYTSKSLIPKAFELEGYVHFQKLGEGLFRLNNGKEELVLDDALIKEEEIIHLFKVKNAVIILTKKRGLFALNGGILTPWKTQADSLLRTISLYSAIPLRNGDIALGTISKGLMVLDADGLLKYQIDQLRGLQNNTVLSLLEDRQGNIWTGLDIGISYISARSPFSAYHDSRGLVGSVYAAALWEGFLYLGTNQGLFYRDMDVPGDFQLVPDTEGQVWFLDVLDDTLFCGHHSGTFTVDKGRANKVFDSSGTWKVAALGESEEVLLQGNYDGLSVLQKTKTGWELSHKIEDFNHSSRYFEVDGDRIFVNHEYRGFFDITVDPQYKKVVSVVVDTVLRSPNSGIAAYRDELIYSSEEGVYRYLKDTRSFEKHEILDQLYTKEDYLSGKLIFDADNGKLWSFSKDNVSYVSRSSLGSSPTITQIPLTEAIRNAVVGYESVTKLDTNGGEKYLFASHSGYFTVDLNQLKVPDFEIQLGPIFHGHDKNDLDVPSKPIAQGVPGDFPSKDNHITFSYFTAQYNPYLKPQYRYQLEGMYDEWSPWSSRASVNFENLPPGDYTFKVTAKIGNTTAQNSASYAFTIQRPWYATTFFRVFYVVVFLVLAYLVHLAYQRAHRKRQKKLIERNRRKMELEKAKNEKEIVRLKNEQLKQEFRSKSNELAASTLSIIKKNELLSKVKEQLENSVADQKSIAPIISVIDQNLDQQDDWEMFKKAFDNADRKFLKKLKKAHPDLSPSEIRLCAYLRLNLSSKEIAPLFHISARSVEIKRYRLRKKMGLPGEKNLTEYILAL